MQILSQKRQVQEEVRQISKYIGLLISRIFLLVCLLLLFYTFRPTSIYLFAFGVAFPPFFASLFQRQTKKTETTLLLDSCAKMYYYTPERFRSELYTGHIFVLGLLLWQLYLGTNHTFAFPLSIAPGLILLGYLLCRIISTKIFQHKIKNYYRNLRILDS